MKEQVYPKSGGICQLPGQLRVQIKILVLGALCSACVSPHPYFRRPLIRHERHVSNYLGFVHLGCLVILLRTSFG